MGPDGAPEFLYVVRFRATPPVGGLDDDPDAIGTFIVCYVKTDSFFGAIEHAAGAIEDDGWIINEPEFAERCETNELLADEDCATYARDAIADGLCLVYITYEQDDE